MADRTCPPGTIKVSRSFEERFWRKVHRTEGCWIWTAAKQRDGYGVFDVRGSDHTSRHVHRITYEQLVGPIPDGYELDHLCRNRACCNPAHLEPVIHAENCARGLGVSVVNASRTHCPQGHPYAGHNLSIHKNGSRRCKMCALLRERARRLRSKSA